MFLHMLTSRRACQSLDSEHQVQHVQLFTWTTYEMVKIRMVTKPFMITIFHGNCRDRYQDGEMVSRTVGLHGAICYPGRTGSTVSFTFRFVRLLGSCSDTLCVCIFPLGWICRLNFATAFCQGPSKGFVATKNKKKRFFSYIWSYDRTRYLDLLVEGDFIL